MSQTGSKQVTKRETKTSSAKVMYSSISNSNNHKKEWSVVVGKSVCVQCLFEWLHGVQWMCVKETKEHR